MIKEQFKYLDELFQLYLENEDNVIPEEGDPYASYYTYPIPAENYLLALKVLLLIPQGQYFFELGVENDGAITFDWHLDHYHTASLSVGEIIAFGYAIEERLDSFRFELEEQLPDEVVRILEELMLFKLKWDESIQKIVEKGMMEIEAPNDS